MSNQSWPQPKSISPEDNRTHEIREAKSVVVTTILTDLREDAVRARVAKLITGFSQLCRRSHGWCEKDDISIPRAPSTEGDGFDSMATRLQTVVFFEIWIFLHFREKELVYRRYFHIYLSF